ncbi:hypothetical protein [Mycobacteroides abscessus]|uniref:hypothetical protein n=1 Tax=Mycobacteroides abscessus TaxID=36809 RepID=UPI0021031276|nr:hypothetical protein [Mycobacteroides abscessus]
MTDDEFFGATAQLQTIHGWARARYAAPWAVLGAVLLRVSASVGPHVQLPGLIGGRASLNLLCAFVSASGGGKGISDKVARLAWPKPILELPIGSGEGIAATFKRPEKEDENGEAISAAIFNVPEVDTLAGIASRQGSILLAQLKSMAMGEQIGQQNASRATSRVVAAHTYRCCLSVGAQPLHTSVIFNDATGGTPQRFLWFPTTDPSMPSQAGPDPAPLNTDIPVYVPNNDGVVEIAYGPDEISQTIISAHLARQRGEGDALDGHALLTRCKVAALLAILHHRSVVSELDWQLSETVMAISDGTRDWITSEAHKAQRAKVRDRAIARAVGDDFYDASRLETVKRSIVRMLERDGEQVAGVLSRRLGKREKRELFDQAIALLEADGLVRQREGEYNGRAYTYWSPMTALVTHENSRSESVTPVVTHDQPAKVPLSETPSSPVNNTPRPTRTALAFVLAHITDHADPDGWTEVSQIYTEGMAEGHSRGAIKQARLSSTSPRIESSSVGRNSSWRIVYDDADTANPGARQQTEGESA